MSLEGPQNFLEVQGSVFQNQEKKNKIEDIMAFIIRNAVLFRYFAEHLPKELYPAWDIASKNQNNKGAIKKLSQHYQSFRSEIMHTLESLDPEAMSEFSEAVDNVDIDKAADILKAYFEMKDKAEAELVDQKLAA